MNKGSCNSSHQWQEWRWAKAQYPVRGQQLQAVWTRLCADCGAQEVRRTPANRRPESDCAALGTILLDRTRVVS